MPKGGEKKNIPQINKRKFMNILYNGTGKKKNNKVQERTPGKKKKKFMILKKQ